MCYSKTQIDNIIIIMLPLWLLLMVLAGRDSKRDGGSNSLRIHHYPACTEDLTEQKSTTAQGSPPYFRELHDLEVLYVEP